MQSRQLTKNTDVNFVPLISNTRVGQKKIKVINLVTKKTKGPSFFPSPNHKKIIIQKGENHCPTTTPTQFRYKKKHKSFPCFLTTPSLSSRNSKNLFVRCLSKAIQRSRSLYNAPAPLAGLFFNLHNVRFILIVIIKDIIFFYRKSKNNYFFQHVFIYIFLKKTVMFTIIL